MLTEMACRCSRLWWTTCVSARRFSCSACRGELALCTAMQRLPNLVKAFCNTHFLDRQSPHGYSQVVLWTTNCQLLL